MTDMVIVLNDHAAGLQVPLPRGWQLDTGELMDPLTSLGKRPELATASRSADGPKEQTSFALGLLDDGEDLGEDLGEVFREDLGEDFGEVFREGGGPSIGEDLLEAAYGLAERYGFLFDFWPDGRETRRERLFDLDGQPAAELTRAYAGARHTPRTGYLRVVVVHLSDGRTSFAMGAAAPDIDRPVIDAIFDGLKPLSAVD